VHGKIAAGFVVNNGVLIFNNAQPPFRVFAGCRYGKIIATNSSFYFRNSIFTSGAYKLHSTANVYEELHLDFNGMAHNIGVSDSAILIQQNVYFTDIIQPPA